MDVGYRIVEVEDWHKIPANKLPYNNQIFCYSNIDEIKSYNMGLYLNNKRQYCVGGFVGVCVLKNIYDEDYIDEAGNKIILKVIPRFKVSPWEMLSKVMNDAEYDKYVIAADARKESFYEIFDDEKPLKLDVDESGGEVLLAVSFIRACYKVCSTILNRRMSYTCENLNGKVRGRIDFNNQIRKNIVNGREDRIYCKYPKFSEDTLENQILKQGLLKSESILRVNSCFDVKGLVKIREMLIYCKKRLTSVTDMTIKRSDFSQVNDKGFNASYAPAINLAKMVLLHSSMSVSSKGEKSSYVVPYAIRMETVFEYYARFMIKELFENRTDKNEWKIDDYKDISDPNDLLKTTKNNDAYIMKSYIPDIAIMHFNKEDGKWEYVTVLDVKYQRSSDPNESSVRHNTHQLFFYMLLLNTCKCGFIFPSEYGRDYGSFIDEIIQQNGEVNGLSRYYSEFHISFEKNENDKTLQRLAKYNELRGMYK